MLHPSGACATPDLAKTFSELETSIMRKPGVSEDANAVPMRQVGDVETSQKTQLAEQDAAESAFMKCLLKFKLDRNIDTKLRSSSRLSVSLARLFFSVLHAGGSAVVTRNKRWASIGRQFNPPSNMTDLSFRTKQIFMTNLHDLELVYAAGEINLHNILLENPPPPPSSVQPLPLSEHQEGSSTPRRSYIKEEDTFLPQVDQELEEESGTSLLGQAVCRGENYTVYKMMVDNGSTLWYTIYAEYPGLTLKDIGVKCFSRGVVRLTVKSRNIVPTDTPTDGSGGGGHDGGGASDQGEELYSETITIIKLPSKICTASGKAFFTDLGQLYVRVKKAENVT